MTARRHTELLGIPGAGAAPDPELDELRFLALLAGVGLSTSAQVLLLLRFGCGVSTEALAAMHHVPRATMAARLTRAKQRLQQSVGAGGGLDVEVEPLLGVITRAVYLIFTAGANRRRARAPPTRTDCCTPTSSVRSSTGVGRARTQPRCGSCWR